MDKNSKLENVVQAQQMSPKYEQVKSGEIDETPEVHMRIII